MIFPLHPLSLLISQWIIRFCGLDDELINIYLDLLKMGRSDNDQLERILLCFTFIAVRMNIKIRGVSNLVI